MDNQQAEKEALDALLRRVQGPGGRSSPAVEASTRPFDDAAAPQEEFEVEHRRPRADLFRSVHLKVKVELGRVHLPLKEALQLGPGSVVDLEKLADDPVDIYVNDLLIARGEVIVVNDCFCVRVTEVFSQSESRGLS
jgi:flagellar motor switch protein FliN/FliY